MNEKSGVTCGQLAIVFILLGILAVVAMTVGKHSWSLSGALGLPDWVIWIAAFFILGGGFVASRKR